VDWTVIPNNDVWSKTLVLSIKTDSSRCSSGSPFEHHQLHVYNITGFHKLALKRPSCYAAGVIINILSWRAMGFHRRAKLFELNFLIRNMGKIILTAGQFALCLALDDTLS